MKSILSNFIDMLSATNIRQKISCLEGKLNEKVFSDKLTIIEDPKMTIIQEQQFLMMKEQKLRKRKL